MRLIASLLPKRRENKSTEPPAENLTDEELALRVNTLLGVLWGVYKLEDVWPETA